MLIRYSLVLSAAITVFFFIITYMQDLEHFAALYRSVIGGLIFLLFSGISILLIVFWEGRYANGTIDHMKLRFILGILITTILMFLAHYLRDYIQTLSGGSMVFYDPDEILYFGEWQIYLLIFVSSTMVYSLVYLLHNFILINHLKSETDREVTQLRMANAETSNQLLRQQIQPHFLFNALNVLKSLIRQDTNTAERYLVTLSDFLRSSFTQSKRGAATLKEEVKLCRDYLEMQKIRFGEALIYRFDLPEAYEHCQLPFFSLQTLAENAIKHNQLTEEKPLEIEIRVQDGMVSVRNNLQRKTVVESSTGSGLYNLSERYQLLTGDQLQIEESEAYFTVRFKTIKHENRHHRG